MHPFSFNRFRLSFGGSSLVGLRRQVVFVPHSRFHDVSLFSSLLDCFQFLLVTGLELSHHSLDGPVDSCISAPEDETTSNENNGTRTGLCVSEVRSSPSNHTSCVSLKIFRDVPLTTSHRVSWCLNVDMREFGDVFRGDSLSFKLRLLLAPDVLQREYIVHGVLEKVVGEFVS